MLSRQKNLKKKLTNFYFSKKSLNFYLNIAKELYDNKKLELVDKNIFLPLSEEFKELKIIEIFYRMSESEFEDSEVIQETKNIILGEVIPNKIEKLAFFLRKKFNHDSNKIYQYFKKIIDSVEKIGLDDWYDLNQIAFEGKILKKIINNLIIKTLRVITEEEPLNNDFTNKKINQLLGSILQEELNRKIYVNQSICPELIPDCRESLEFCLQEAGSLENLYIDCDFKSYCYSVCSYLENQEKTNIDYNKRKRRVDPGCYIGGCSGNICSNNPKTISTCIYKSEYICYQKADCIKDIYGQCKWRMTDELVSCLEKYKNN